MLRLKDRPNQPGPIFSTLYTYFVQIFLLINYSLQDPNYIHPRILLFLRPPFMTPTRDSHLRPTFATHIPRLTFATHIRDPHSRLHSRLTLATRLHSRLIFATPDRAPNRDLLFFVVTSIVRLHH